MPILRAPFTRWNADTVDATKDEQPSSVAGAQTDGAPRDIGGSGLHDSEYDVHVKLGNQQADPNNPLFSIKSFEDLGLWVLYLR